jgi:hypothetical protein
MKPEKRVMKKNKSRIFAILISAETGADSIVRKPAVPTGNSRLVFFQVFELANALDVSIDYLMNRTTDA